MRKLTAGIFFVLWGLVSVGGANAAVVSTGYLDEVLEGVQAKMTANGPVKIENNVVSVETGAVSETGTNLVTAAGIYAAVADQQVKANLVKTGTDGAVVAPAEGAENDTYPSYAAAVAIARNEVGVLTGGVATLQGDISTLKTNVADIKDTIGGLGDGVTVESALGTKADKTALAATDAKVTANETAIATEKSAREAADAQLQTNINLKANAADVYSKNDADAKFEAQAAATAKLQEAKNYTDEQLKTLTEDMWGGGEGSEDQGLQGVVASQALKITALEDKVGDKSVVARISELDSADKAVDKEFVTAVSENDGVITVSRRALAAADIPVIAVSQVDGLQAALDAKQVNLTGQDGVIVIADGVVSIASQGITSTMIKDEAIVEAKLAANSVTSTKIQDEAIVEAKLAAESVTSTKIKNGAITNEKLGAQAVKGTNIENNAVGTQQLADDVNLLLAGAIQAPTSESVDGTYVLTAKKITGTDNNVTYSYAWENIAGRVE